MVFAAELGSAWVSRPADDSLVFGGGDRVLKFFPGRVSAIAETTSAFDAARFETLSASAHAERFFGLRLILRRAHDPVLVLLLLLLQDLSIPC